MKSSQIGRFDQSFVIRMIRDFFLALLIVVVAEIGFRFALAYYKYENEGKRSTVNAARDLADDIKAIMLNSGGPVAARTIYPILKRNNEQLGFQIAVFPSHITQISIQKVFGFKPKGIPPRWPEGKHQSEKVVIRAEKFCTSCHETAAVGDTLGTVEVRNYFSTNVKSWWEDVRLASVFGMGNIIIHTLVLFFLLRARMEPLLALRSLISTLSRGKLDLSYRAEIKSDDEFGELALALNNFLERICSIVDDVHKVLSRMVSVNTRLKQVSGQMGDHFLGIQTQTQTAIKIGMDAHQKQGLFSEEALQTLQALVSILTLFSEKENLPPDYRKKMEEIARNLGRLLQGTRKSVNRLEDFSENLFVLSDRVREHTHFMKELSLLEERMKIVAENGQTLLNSLTGSGNPSNAQAPKEPEKKPN